MDEIKIYNQEGLIYFDNFRVKELLLLKSEDNGSEYLLIIDIQTYDYFHSESDIVVLAQKFPEKIINQFNYVWVRFEEFCDLLSLDDLDGFELEMEDSEDKYLYFDHRHVFLYNNKLKLERIADTYRIVWEATSDNSDERAIENKVEISCAVDLFVFRSKEEWQKHDKLRNRQRDYYFDILNQLQGKQDLGNKEIDISEIKLEYTEKQKSEWAWKIALDRVRE